MTAKRHILAFDGLRGLAILAIVLYHMRPSLLSGGFIAVTLFFVLSGYLLRASLSRVLDEGIASRIKLFAKRVFRLWPALLVTVASTAILFYLFSPSLLLKIQADALAASLFFLNIHFIYQQLDYFAAAGLPSPLTHLWYTAVLLQVMLAWLIFTSLLKAITRSHRIERRLSFLIVLASASYMAFAYHMSGATLAYYSPIARLAEFALGSYAFVLMSDIKQKAAAFYKIEHQAPAYLKALSLCGYLTIFLLLVASYFADGQAAYMYYGGFLCVAILSALMILAVQLPGNHLAKLLSLAPLRALGSISYSLYLLHYPLIICMNPATRTTKPAVPEIVLQLGVMLIAAIVLYLLVERASQHIKAAKRPARLLLLLLSSISLCIVFFLSFAGLNWNELVKERSYVLRPELKEQLDTNAKPSIQEPVSETNASDASSDQSEDKGPKAEKVPTNLPWQNWTFDKEKGISSAKILVIGDSVTEAMAASLEQAFPNAKVDGKVSRQLASAPEVYQADTQGFDPEAVVVALGTNSLIRDPGQIQQAIDMVQGKPLYFVSIRSPYPLQDMNNELIRSYAAKNDNVGIIDWCGASEGHSEYLVDDGVHLTDTGISALVDLYLLGFRGKVA